MTFDKVWKRFCGKRIVLSKPGATLELTVEEIKELLRDAYEDGCRDGEEESTNSGLF